MRHKKPELRQKSTEGRLIAVAVITYNSAHVLRRCLESLPSGLPVFVVDNGSTDNTVEAAAAFGAKVHQMGTNRGYSAAANAAMTLTETSWVLVLNPDVVLSDGSLENLLSVAHSHDSAGAVGPVAHHDDLVFVKRRSIIAAPKATLSLESSPPCQFRDVINGSAMLIRRKAFDDIGGFDENIFHFFEDDDFCRRLYMSGWKCVVAYGAFVHHVAGTSTLPTAWLEFQRGWHYTWSQQFVLRKHCIPERPVRGVRRALQDVFSTLLRRPNYLARPIGALAGWIAFYTGRKATDAPITIRNPSAS